MTRTKALVVVGCIMLALAVMAALELTQEPPVPVEGQVVTGTISNVPPVRMNTDAPTAPLGGDVPAVAQDNTPPRNNGLISLEPGTLRPESETPATPPMAPAQVPDSPSVPPQAAEPRTTPVSPAAPTPAGSQAPTASAQAQSSPEKHQPAQVPPTASAQAPDKAPTSPATKTEAKTEAKPASEKAQTPPAAPAPQKAAEPASPAQGKTPAKAPAENKETDTTPGKNAAEPQAIDTAGPAKVEPGQKAIVWTRLELTDKGAVFRISGADKLEGKAFVLPDPHRYVVDLQGAWAMRLPSVPANGFIKKIRYGKQENNTRMVIDLDGEKNCQMVRINPTTLELRVRN